MSFSFRGTLMPHTRLRLTRALKFGGCMAACERPVGTMGENSIGLLVYVHILLWFLLVSGDGIHFL